MHQTFGDTIREARLAQGRTQRDVSLATGLTITHISNIELGAECGREAARLICNTLGLGRPWPAVAALENLATKVAREQGITREQAYTDLVTDLKRAVDEYEAEAA